MTAAARRAGAAHLDRLAVTGAIVEVRVPPARLTVLDVFLGVILAAAVLGLVMVALNITGVT